MLSVVSFYNVHQLINKDKKMTDEIDTTLLKSEFETSSLKLIPHWKVTFAAPTEDVDRIFDEIIKYAPLAHG